MTGWASLQLALYVVVLLALARPLGEYMARVYEGKAARMEKIVGPLEHAIYRLSGVQADDEMNWKTYALAMLVFNFASIVVVYAILRLQALLPLNPEKCRRSRPTSPSTPRSASARTPTGSRTAANRRSAISRR